MMMNIQQYIGAPICFFVLSSPLQASEAGFQELNAQHRMFENGQCLDNQLLDNCSRSKSLKFERSKSAFFSASTPINYVGQNIGVAPVPSGTIVSVQFPVIGDQSRPSAIKPRKMNSKFEVREAGHYLINWDISVTNPNSNPPGPGGNLGTFFDVVLLKDGLPIPPNPDLKVAADGKIPTSQFASGSSILHLEKGSKVQLNITSGSVVPTIPIPLFVNSASINFVRIAL